MNTFTNKYKIIATIKLHKIKLKYWEFVDLLKTFQKPTVNLNSSIKRL